MKTITKLAALSLIVLQANSTFAEEKMKTQEILTKTVEVYAKCKSYKDSGYVRTVFLNKDGTTKFITKKVFKTAFIRPAKFRFEYAEKKADELQNKYIIWKDGKNIKSFWEIKGEETPKSLSMAIAGATGISSGTAHNIPTLLISEVRGRKITNMKNPIILKEGKDDNGKLCYLIKAEKKQKNETFILWVQKETFLITKIETTTIFDKFDTESVTIYQPQININIPEAELKFKK